MTTDPARPGAASTTRAQRPKSWRPGFTKSLKRWDPDRAAASPGYPQTPGAFEARRQQQAERMRRQNAEGKMGRQGVPDGWAGRRAEAEAARLQAAEEGRQDVAELRRQDRLLNDDPRAVEALAFACAVVRDPTEPPSTKTMAARLVLAFTKAPPAAQQHVAGSAGMAWLAELAARSAP